MRALLFLAFTLSSLIGLSQSYEIVLSTDFNGEVVKGSKKELIKLIREGKPVRVGYQLDFNEDKEADFDHWLEATFITILKNEVFTQIDPIYGQAPNIDIPQVQIFSNNTQWTAVIGTNGKLLNRYIPSDDTFPELIYDVDLGITKEEFQEQLDQMNESKLAMKKVETWNVATFWSVLK